MQLQEEMCNALIIIVLLLVELTFHGENIEMKGFSLTFLSVSRSSTRNAQEDNLPASILGWSQTSEQEEGGEEHRVNHPLLLLL